MNLHQWLKPLIALIGSLLMCGILSACQATRATTDATTHSNTKPSIAPHASQSERSLYIDGKKAELSKLSDEQKAKLRQLESELYVLEQNLDINEEAMQAWSAKMEAITDKIEIDLEAIESIEVDFDGATISLKDLAKISHAISKKSQHLEINMQTFEQEMQALEKQMPKIDESALQALQAKAHEIEKLVIQVVAVE